MSKFIKIIDDELIEISDYRNPNAVFHTREYVDYESLCIFKEVINPFVLYGENKQLKSQLQQKENIIKEVREYIEKYDFITGYYEHNYDDENDTYTHYTVKEELLEILDKENK